MHTPGFWQVLLILGIVVLLFGGKKLPELGAAIGETIKNFKKGVKDDDKKIGSDDKPSGGQS